MEQHLLAKLNPELLDASCIETLNELTKEDLIELKNAYPNHISARNYLSLEYFKDGKSKGKSQQTYLSLLNTLASNNADSYSIYAVTNRNGRPSLLAVKEIEKSEPIITIFSDLPKLEEVVDLINPPSNGDETEKVEGTIDPTNPPADGDETDTKVNDPNPKVDTQLNENENQFKPKGRPKNPNKK